MLFTGREVRKGKKQFFPIRTDLSRWMTFLIFVLSFFLKVSGMRGDYRQN